MKTTTAIAKGILLGAALIAVAMLTGCSINKAFPVGPNPLDEPGSTEPTGESIQRGHVRSITNNPTL